MINGTDLDLMDFDKQNVQKNFPKNTDTNNLIPDMVSKDKVKPLKNDPTRYGDWEKGGRCIDF